MPSYVLVKSADDHARRFPRDTHNWEGVGLYNKAGGTPIQLPQGDEVCAPMVMRDISEFVARAHKDKPARWKPQLIGSRSTLRSYEASNGLRQNGDFKPGEIAHGQNKADARETARQEKLAAKTGLRGPRKDFEWL